MATETTTLTSYIVEGKSGSALTYTNTDQVELLYTDLGYVPSKSDSYKSTSGDVFKVYIDGIRIYRKSDSDYATGNGFLESGDTATSSGATKLNGLTSIDETAVSVAGWDNTSDTVWTINTGGEKVIIDIGEITNTNLYGSDGKDISITTTDVIIELRRAVQDRSTPAINFSNASLLTEQDLDNSTKNTFHIAQEAINDVENALIYNVGSGTWKAHEPGTTNVKKIEGVADGTADNDATNVGQFNTHDAAIEAQKVATLAYKEDTEDYKLETADWATKVGGVVNTYTRNVAQSDGSEYSAKEYSQGTTVATGSAKQWALGGGSFVEGTAVAGGVYSAKRYASLAAADLVLTNADVVSAEADKVQTGLDRIATAADKVATNADVVLTNADVILAEADKVQTGLDRVATAADKVATNADVVLTHADELLTRADTVLTAADVVSTAASASAAATSETNAATSAANAATSYDSFDDRYLGSKSSNPSVDNDGNALVTGALFYNSSTSTMMVYSGSEWIAATAAGQSSLDEYKFVTTSGQVSSKTYSGTADVGGTLSYIQDNIIVFMNGVQLKDTTDYTATNGTSIVLVVAPALNDEISVVAFKSFTLSDMVSKSSGGTFAGAVTFSAGLTGSVGTLTSATISGDLTVDTNTLKVDSTNNRVGIGTTAPSSIFEIVDASSPQLRIKDSTNNHIVGMQSYDTAANVGTVSNTRFDIISNNSERITISTDGSVGIGTTAPVSLLQIDGDDPKFVIGPATPDTWYTGSYDMGIVQIGNHVLYARDDQGASSFGGMGHNSYLDTGGDYNYMITDEASNYYQASGAHHFKTAASGTAGATITWISAMTILVDGKVGIGDTNPSSKLTVNGDIETSTTGKVKQKGAFMQNSVHQSWVMGG